MYLSNTVPLFKHDLWTVFVPMLTVLKLSSTWSFFQRHPWVLPAANKGELTSSIGDKIVCLDLHFPSPRTLR